MLTPLNLVFEIIFSKVSGHFPANFAKNHLLTLLPVLQICVFIQLQFLYTSINYMMQLELGNIILHVCIFDTAPWEIRPRLERVSMM